MDLLKAAQVEIEKHRTRDADAWAHIGPLRAGDPVWVHGAPGRGYTATVFEAAEAPTTHVKVHKLVPRYWRDEYQREPQAHPVDVSVTSVYLRASGAT